MFKKASILLWALLIAIVTVHADDAKTFVVQDGAFPWYDRVNQWALADVPESLKGTGPIPQQNCSSRGLEIPDNPKVVTIGISKTDLEKFKQKFPTTTETGEVLTIANAGGTKIPYIVATLSDPPAKIVGAGEFGAGLLLLKNDGATAAKPVPVEAPKPAPAPPVADAGDKTFVVQDGAFPWYDRVNQWALADVPASLNGAGPLPQQNCSGRALDTPGQPKSITLGVSQGDVAQFKTLYPNATATGETLAVKNSQDARIPYQVMTLPNPPAKIGDGAGFGAGLLLLKVGDAATNPAATTPQTAPQATTPAAPVPAAPVPAAPVSAAPIIPAIAAPIVTAPVGVALPVKDQFQIYLLMGQSNMVGRDTSTINSQIDNSSILALDGNGKWVVAHEPMHVGGSGIGPGIPFALEMLKKKSSTDHRFSAVRGRWNAAQSLG